MLNFLAKHEETAYAIFRIFIGLLFLLHGLQKIFGLFGGIDGAGLIPPALSLIWWAGLIELVAGLGIALGIFVRPLAVTGLIEMAVAYFKVHQPLGSLPIQNQGEMAALYFFAFIIIAMAGAKGWCLEKIIFKKEIF